MRILTSTLHALRPTPSCRLAASADRERVAERSDGSGGERRCEEPGHQLRWVVASASTTLRCAHAPRRPGRAFRLRGGAGRVWHTAALVVFVALFLWDNSAEQKRVEDRERIREAQITRGDREVIRELFVGRRSAPAQQPTFVVVLRLAFRCNDRLLAPSPRRAAAIGARLHACRCSPQRTATRAPSSSRWTMSGSSDDWIAGGCEPTRYNEQ